MSSADQEQHDQHLREKDTEKLSDPDLVSSVAASLAGIEGEPAEEELEAESTPEDVNTKVDSEDENVNEDVDAQADETEDTEPTLEDSEVAAEIPGPYLRSAIHMGWSEEDVVGMCDKIGSEQTMALLRDVHEKDNNLTARFAEQGRLSKQAPVTPPDVVSDKPAAAKKIDVAALRERYGDDDPLVDLAVTQQEELTRITQQLGEVNGKLANTQHAVTRQQIETEQNARRTIEGFFADKTLEPYRKFYGELKEGDTDWRGLSAAQSRNRDSVCQFANDIIGGVRLGGSDMSVDEALARAHAVISEPITETVTRHKIMSEVEKRHNARVVRPSKGKSTSSSTQSGGKPRTRSELIARTNESLAEVFS